MYTSEAQVWTATTLDEALQLRAEHPEATILAGGTDVMVFIEGGTLRPESVLNIWPCADLKGIESNGNGVRIGALSTWTEVGLCTELPSALRECAATVGAAQIQNRATVGGNIVNASPAGDSLPLWLVLDAQFELASVRGRRMVPASEFWTGYRTTALAADELLLAVHISWDPTDEIVYRKVGTRMAQSISKVVLGGRLRVRDGIVAEARVAMGSVAPVPLRLPSVEAALIGGPISAQAADQVHLDIQPIDDVRSTADYRVAVAARVVRSWLERAAK
jgi:xanthine dehydrogenase small subunit